MYIIVEIQSTGNDAAYLVDKKFTLDEAYNKYHTILAAAAISNVPKHSAVLLDDDGYTIENKVFIHNQEGNENVN